MIFVDDFVLEETREPPKKEKQNTKYIAHVKYPEMQHGRRDRMARTAASAEPAWPRRPHDTNGRIG